MFLIDFFTSGPPIIFSITVALVVWIVLRKRYCASTIRRKKPSRDHSESNCSTDKLTSCSSLDCVRCHRYKHLLPQVENRLNTYISSGKEKKLECLCKAIQEKAHTQVSPEDRQCPNVLYLPYLEAKVWWNTDVFKGDISLLEDNWEVIRQECEATISEDGWLANSTENGCWATFYFYNQGKRNEKNCQLCPQTTSLLDSLSNTMTGNVFGNILFSVLYPGTEVAPHFGPCNIRIRCHLGLVVPSSCSLTVDDEEQVWQEGKCMLFDDSFLHSANNRNSQHARVVFLVDLWHPQLNGQERPALNHVYSS